MSASKRILDVGQCGVDGPRIKRYLTRGFNCTVDQAHTKEEAVAFAQKNKYDLVLVNRILNDDRSPGIDVISALHTAHPDLKIMLVSDRPDAQEQATQQGAIKGFGKAALDSPETEDLICSALGNC